MGGTVEHSVVCRALQAGLSSLIIISMMYPICALVAKRSPRLAYICFTVVTCLRNISGTFAFTSCMVIVNMVAPKRYIGAVNGVGQTLASFVRGAGPALGGGLWSLSVGSGVAGSQFFLFAFISGVAVGGHLLYSFMDPSS
jgi:hypothetical protein